MTTSGASKKSSGKEKEKEKEKDKDARKSKRRRVAVEEDEGSSPLNEEENEHEDAEEERAISEKGESYQNEGTSVAKGDEPSKEDDTRSLIERRLDRLAWLCEGRTKCAAVSIINGEFLISTNEFFNKTKNEDNAQLTQVRDIMEYFQDVANGNLPSEEARVTRRDELLFAICKNQLNEQARAGVVISDKMIKDIVSSQMLSAMSLSFEKGKSTIDFRKPGMLVVFGYGRDLYRSFLKIEESIDGKRADKKFEKDHVDAFKNFKSGKTGGESGKFRSNILFLPNDDGKDVHAEMQILNNIVKMIEKKIEKAAEGYVENYKRDHDKEFQEKIDKKKVELKEEKKEELRKKKEEELKKKEEQEKTSKKKGKGKKKAKGKGKGKSKEKNKKLTEGSREKTRVKKMSPMEIKAEERRILKQATQRAEYELYKEKYDELIRLSKDNPLKLPSEIYIGISKKCCFNCHIALEAAKNELSKFGVNIKFGGAHDASFESNWGRPPFFINTTIHSGRTRNEVSDETSNKPMTLSQVIYAGYSELKKDALAESVGKPEEKVEKEIKKDVEEGVEKEVEEGVGEGIGEDVEESSDKYGMRHSYSDSEPEAVEAKFYMQGFMEEHRVLKEYLGNEDERVKTLATVLKLFEKDTIKDIFIYGKINEKIQHGIEADLKELGLDDAPLKILDFIEKWHERKGRELDNTLKNNNKEEEEKGKGKEKEDDEDEDDSNDERKDDGKDAKKKRDDRADHKKDDRGSDRRNDRGNDTKDDSKNDMMGKRKAHHLYERNEQNRNTSQAKLPPRLLASYQNFQKKRKEEVSQNQTPKRENLSVEAKGEQETTKGKKEQTGKQTNFGKGL